MKKQTIEIAGSDVLAKLRYCRIGKPIIVGRATVGICLYLTNWANHYNQLQTDLASRPV